MYSETACYQPIGRPWQNSNGSTTPYANNKTVFINAKMSTSIRPEGWSVWDAGTQTDIITYAEYVSTYFNGTPVDISQRVAWSKQLTLPELLPYDLATIFSGWDPLAILGGACNSNPGLAVSNLRAVKGASNSDITWNASWPINGVLFELFRSVDGGAFSSVSSVTSTNDSSINFATTDVIPPPGGIYKYYILASKGGYSSAISDTITVSSAPTLQVVGGLGSFIQGLGAPSATQSYTLSGFNLLGNVTVTPPANFEVSSDDGANWFTNASPLVINPGGAILAATVIKVRLNATILGDWAGSVINSTTGPGNVPVPVVLSGKTLAQLPDAPGILHWWPMSTNNLDSAAVRSSGVTPSTPTFNNLYLSTNPTYPAYSASRGQAFGASADGTGMWSTAAGGPGGNLNRTFYEQFTVTAIAGKTVRVDSIILSTAFLLTTSNIKLAVVYSKSGFVSDSADVTGGVGPGGTLAGTANGAFATPIILTRNDNGPTNPGDTYRLALMGASGITIGEGETVSIRLYYSCGSTGVPRFAFLKDVIVNGLAQTTPPQVLQHWPMNVDNLDSASVRSDALTPSVPSFNNLYISNGTTNTFYQPYSVAHGQAFGASANGSGEWSTGVGGPGGNLSRIYYEQFTVTTVGGKGVRIDSIILKSAFLLTTSNTKLAVVWSKTGFVSDSADVTGGVGPIGTLAGTANGAFATPIILQRQDNVTTDTYRLAINGDMGISIADGESITIRLYYACASTGVPRYAFLKDVMIKGVKQTALPVKLLSFNAGLAGSKANLWWKTSNEVELSHFEIERSSDALRFGKVGNVEAFNNTANNAYAFQDDLSAEITNGKKIAYYRLKLVDQDGKYSYSQVIPVLLAGKSGRLILYPNPVQDRVVVIHEKAASQASIRILAADGRQLSQSIPAKDAEQSIVNTSMLPTGTYMLVFDNAGTKTFSKFVKQ
jgi:hypothetical protein